jgi:hypothetical protein
MVLRMPCVFPATCIRLFSCSPPWGIPSLQMSAAIHDHNVADSNHFQTARKEPFSEKFTGIGLPPFPNHSLVHMYHSNTYHGLSDMQKYSRRHSVIPFAAWTQTSVGPLFSVHNSPNGRAPHQFLSQPLRSCHTSPIIQRDLFHRVT